MWIPSAEELKRITGTDRFEFPCGTSVWGSITVCAELEQRQWEDPQAYVACCVDCGRFLKEIV